MVNPATRLPRDDRSAERRRFTGPYSFVDVDRPKLVIDRTQPCLEFALLREKDCTVARKPAAIERWRDGSRLGAVRHVGGLWTTHRQRSAQDPRFSCRWLSRRRAGLR